MVEAFDGKGVLHDRDLARDTFDELRPVSASDPEASAVDARLAPVALRIDHRHTAGADANVVDVRTGTGDSEVVEDGHPVIAEEPGQPAADALLAFGATSPCPLRLRLTIEAGGEPSEPAEASAMDRASRVAPTLVLGPSARAGEAVVLDPHATTVGRAASGLEPLAQRWPRGQRRRLP